MDKKSFFKTKFFSRLFRLVVSLLGISFVSFLLMYIAPNDPVVAMYAASGQIPSEEIIAQTRTQLGLDRPFIVQYVSWLGNCLVGDFGTSISQNKPVADLLASRLMPTINLTLLSVLFMLIFALPLGIISAVNQNKFADYITRFITFIQISMPNFWVGLLLMYIFALKLQWVSVVSPTMNFSKMVLPATTLAFAMAGKYARQLRASILDQLSSDYVTGATARGISKTRILWRHVIPNAMLPLVTLLGLSIGSLLGGTAVVEIIFSYPALGSLAISAITAMDYPLIQGFVLWTALGYMLVNMIVDFSYQFIDPRLKKTKE